MPSVKLSQWAKDNNVSYEAAYKRFQRGKFPEAFKGQNGIEVEIEDVSWKDDLIELQREKIKRLEEEIRELKKLIGNVHG